MKPVNLRYMLAAVGLLAAVAAIAFAVSRFRTHTLVLAVAESNSTSYAAGAKLAEIVAREVPRLRIELLPTAGSVESINLLEAGDADLAIVLANVPPAPSARAVADLYPQVYHLVATEGSGIEQVTDLRGKRVAVPQAESGSYNAFLALIDHYGLSPDDLAALENLPATAMSDALRAGTFDAYFAVAILGDARVAAMLQTPGAHLVPITQVAALQLRQPLLEAAIIPQGAYRANPPIPATDLTTVAVETVLLAHETVDRTLVAALTAVLFDFQRELAAAAPPLVALRSPLEANTLAFPLHQGAEDYFFRDQPGFLERRADEIGLWITVITLAGSGLLALRSWLASHRADPMDRYDREMVAIIDATQAAPNAAELAHVEKRLLALLKSAVDDQQAERLDRDAFDAFMVTWNNTAESLHHRQDQLDTPPD